MHAGVSTARPARAGHRHDLHTLTYVTLDEANGGIVRNVSHEGIAVQAVAALRPGQQLRVRFELRNPRLRVEARGEVMWATSSGRCGIRFLDLPLGMIRQINEWIFGSLLEQSAPYRGPGFSVTPASIFDQGKLADEGLPAGGLTISETPVKVIELLSRPQRAGQDTALDEFSPLATDLHGQLDWLSRPLSGRGLAWTIDALTLVAALLLFVLVFLSVTREPPKWPLAMASCAAVFVFFLYWGFFKICGGPMVGTRLARLLEPQGEEEEEAYGDRFR
jgi:hypothetical protein